jgi:hypothetical protein
MSGDTNVIVSSITDLRAVDSTRSTHAFVTGYRQAGDGGGGHYYLDTGDTGSPDNGGTVIVAEDGARWKVIQQGAVSIKQFGARVDGSTDDQAFVQAALDAVNHVFFPSGVCAIAATLILRSNVLVELAPDAVVDFSQGGGKQTLFVASGSLDPFVPLIATGERGSRLLDVEAPERFVAGDWIKIKAETIFDAGAEATHSKIGEINRINRVGPGPDGGGAPTTLLLMTHLQDRYDVGDGGAVAKLHLVENVTIRGGTLRGSSAINNLQNGIGFNYTLNCRVEDVRLEQFDTSFVAVGNSTGTTVTGCRFMMHQPQASLNYGVVFGDAASNGVVTNNHYEQVRHAFTTGNNPSSSHGIVRRIVFANNTIIRSAQALSGAGGDAIDTHTAAEDISIIGNTILGSSGQGINVECPTAVIIGNTINDAQSTGISAHNEADRNGSVVIANNRLERCIGRGIDVRQGSRGTTFAYTEVVVDGNSIRETEIGITVRTLNSNPTVLRDVSITGNSVRDTQGTGIVISGIRCGTVTGNSLSKIGGKGIDGSSLDSVSINGNSIVILSKELPGIEIGGGAAGNSDSCSIVGNTVAVNSGTSAQPNVNLEAAVTHTAVVGNVQRGMGPVNLGSGAGNIKANNL